MSVFLVTAVEVKDWDLYQRYSDAGVASLVGTEGEVLVVDDAPFLMEGQVPGGRIVILKFPDQMALNKWYQSEAYQSAREIRHRAADTPFMIRVNAFAPP